MRCFLLQTKESIRTFLIITQIIIVEASFSTILMLSQHMESNIILLQESNFGGANFFQVGKICELH